MRLTPEENLLSEILREAIDCATGALECGGLPPLSSGGTSGGNSWILRTQASARESGEQAPVLQRAIAQRPSAGTRRVGHLDSAFVLLVELPRSTGSRKAVAVNVQDGSAVGATLLLPRPEHVRDLRFEMPDFEDAEFTLSLPKGWRCYVRDTPPISVIGRVRGEDESVL